MWSIRQSIRTLVAFSHRGRRVERRAGRPGPSAADWLPPVMNPGDWSLNLMADRSAGWYFDRD